MPIHPTDIERKVFSTVRLKEGYAQHEVDAFLDLVTEDYRLVLQQVEHYKGELEKVVRGSAAAAAHTVQFTAVSPSGAIPTLDLASAPHSAALLLQSAQKTADEIAAAARAEAEKLINEAHDAAGKIVADANVSLASAGKRLDDLKATHAATAKLLQDALAALHFVEEPK